VCTRTVSLNSTPTTPAPLIQKVYTSPGQHTRLTTPSSDPTKTCNDATQTQRSIKPQQAHSDNSNSTQLNHAPPIFHINETQEKRANTTPTALSPLIRQDIQIYMFHPFLISHAAANQIIKKLYMRIPAIYTYSASIHHSHTPPTEKIRLVYTSLSFLR
jgi:hypothetical protein